MEKQHRIFGKLNRAKAAFEQVTEGLLLADCTHPASEPKAATEAEGRLGHPNPSAKRPSGSGSGHAQSRD